MMYKKSFQFFLVWAVLLTGVKGQPPLSLPQAIRAAWSNRKNMQAGRLDSAIERLQTQALIHKYLPQLSLEYSYQYNPLLQSSIIPVGKFNPSLPPNSTESIQFGTTWSGAAGLSLVQPLVDAEIKNQIRESRLQERISGATQQQAEYELAYDVAKAYINVYLSELAVKSAVVDSASTWISWMLQKDNFDAGRLLKSDLNKARINHNNARQKVADGYFQVVENKILLLFLTGKLSAGQQDLEIDSTLFSRDISSWLALNPAPDSIPALGQLNLQGQLAALQQNTEKARFMPTLSLKGFLGANQFSNQLNPFASNSWFGYSYIGLDAKLPIWTGEDKHRKLQQLRLQQVQYHQQLGDKTDQYAQATATARIELERSRSQLLILQENLLLARESLDIIQDRVREGQESASRLTTEELEWQRLSAEYDNASKQAWLYWIDYLKASGLLGRLWN